MKIDITVGDAIIPHEIEYQYQLLFEDRTIPVMAYNLCTILAEKIETIISRNVANTRGRDFYDVYILLSRKKNMPFREELLHALRVKAEERGSIKAIENSSKHLRDIADSPDIAKIWAEYVKSYPYAKGITLSNILELIECIFQNNSIIEI